METSEIRIFESISLLSKLMPYYGSSHIGFLLLSLLSKSVRGYLLEHYPQYRRFMFKYAKMKDYMIYKLSKMKLPLDLFKFQAIDVRYEKEAELLVDLIYTLFNLIILEDWALLFYIVNSQTRKDCTLVSITWTIKYDLRRYMLHLNI